MTSLDDLIAGLLDPRAYPHPVEKVEHIETHISHVLLAGDYAYKIKKALDLGFLDFSTLERRKFCCEEEIRLNGRLAPNIYLEVVPVTGSAQAPRVGGPGRVLEFAVKMRRFDQDRLLTNLPVTNELADRIAARLARFHREIPSAPDESPFGTPEAVLQPMLTNFEQIRARLGESQIQEQLQRLEDWTKRRHQALSPHLQRRKREGHIRECHGDMHRGNIAYDAGDILIFDGIEFNPDLRWIDTISEMAFLIMDLEDAGETPRARRLLNRYLDVTGDYAGLPLLDFYKVYRAMVRAKVIAIRQGQEGVDAQEATEDRQELLGYVDLAETYTRVRPQAIYLTHGVSGTGKSRLSAALSERLPLIHIRSDIERKRLFGLTATARSSSRLVGEGIYERDAGLRTYARLRELARLILDSGYSPLVDATFLKEGQRRPMLELAAQRGCTCIILDLYAPESVLRARVARREAEAMDPSEAGVSVLESQLATREPLTEEERRLAVRVDATDPEAASRIPRW